MPAHCDAGLLAEAARALDEDGWADPHGLADPPPNDPDEMVDQLRAELERWIEHGEAAERRGKLLEIARKLRWCRQHTDRFEAWGEAVGRLRWATSRRGAGLEEVAQALDPLHRPPMAWPKVLGVDPEKRRKQAERRRLLGELAGGELTSPESLGAWLVAAFRVFDGERLTALLGEQRSQVLALDEGVVVARADAAVRRMARRRLASLKVALASDIGSAGSRQAIAAAMAEEPAPAAAEPPAVDPQERLRSTARVHTSGRRAVLVSNRSDPELRERLRTELGFSDLEWNEGEPRRLRALSDAIRRGGFQLVLAATGFQSHAADAMLASACRAADVPYVRVNRARPLAVYRAITRDLAARAAAPS